MEKSKKAIRQTLTYSDIFDFPLTANELWRFLKSDKQITYVTFYRTLQQFPQTFGFYTLPNRQKLVKERLKKQAENIKKLRQAEWVASVLAVNPSVYFIGISGSLALQNAKPNDDIDLFIITKHNTLWSTRVTTLLLLQLLGLRRKKSDKKTANKICVNYFLDERELQFKKTERNIYIAHEIAQLVPLFERKRTYTRFLRSNAWIGEYMPNALSNPPKSYIMLQKWQRVCAFAIKIIFFSFISEPLSKYIQQKSIQKTLTTETVTDTRLAFHPYNYATVTLRKFEQRKKHHL